MPLQFEWDPIKDLLNIDKHSISFITASEVFFDSNLIERYDAAHSTINEDRYIAIGLAHSDLLTVVYTDRNGVIRIISAREATETERSLYYDRPL